MEYVQNPILRRFRSLLARAYGEHLKRVVLFGSRARGDARPDSDHDIAVFLNRSESFWEESGRLAEIETDMLYDRGVVINALPFAEDTYMSGTGLMHEIRREGRDI